MKILNIIRGLPGSGKTTFAKKHLKCDPIEADQFFEGFNKKYYFDREHLSNAHLWCKLEVTRRMLQEVPHIVVSNTFTTLWEITPYIELATKFGYRTEIFTMKQTFTNIHGVPKDSLEKMQKRWEPVDNEVFINAFNIEDY